jgi:hypothetical protein
MERFDPSASLSGLETESIPFPLATLHLKQKRRCWHCHCKELANSKILQAVLLGLSNTRIPDPIFREGRTTLLKPAVLLPPVLRMSLPSCPFLRLDELVSQES